MPRKRGIILFFVQLSRILLLASGENRNRYGIEFRVFVNNEIHVVLAAVKRRFFSDSACLQSFGNVNVSKRNAIFKRVISKSFDCGKFHAKNSRILERISPDVFNRFSERNLGERNAIGKRSVPNGKRTLVFYVGNTDVVKILKSLERSVADQFIAGGDNDLFEILAIFKSLAFNRDDFLPLCSAGSLIFFGYSASVAAAIA